MGSPECHNRFCLAAIPFRTEPLEQNRDEGIKVRQRGHYLSHNVTLVVFKSKNQRLRTMMDDNIQFIGRALRNMGVADGDVDDAVQRTFIVAAERLADIRTGAERSFLFQTALRIATHARRSHSRRSTLVQARAMEPNRPVETPEEIVGRRRQRVLLDQALDGLDNPLRAVFVLYEIEEMTMAEVAEVMDIPPGTVASRLRRARRAFQEKVRELSLECEVRSA